MKKSEAMDLYEGLNGISPKMIEEAGNYKKTASVEAETRAVISWHQSRQDLKLLM